jgi:hypothetical protein
LNLFKNRIALAIEPGREERRGGFSGSASGGYSPGAALAEAVAQSVAVIGAVRQQDLPGPNALKHIGGDASVMGLPFGELQSNGQAIGVDKGVDLGARPPASDPCNGSLSFFGAIGGVL